MKTCHFFGTDLLVHLFFSYVICMLFTEGGYCNFTCWYFNPENSEEIRGDIVMYWTGWNQICCQHDYSREGIMEGLEKYAGWMKGMKFHETKYWSSLITSSVFDQPNLLTCWDIGRAKALGMNYIICKYIYICMYSYNSYMTTSLSNWVSLFGAPFQSGHGTGNAERGTTPIAHPPMELVPSVLRALCRNSHWRLG